MYIRLFNFKNAHSSATPSNIQTNHTLFLPLAYWAILAFRFHSVSIPLHSSIELNSFLVNLMQFAQEQQVC